jgi:methylglyoxal synthase
LGRPAEAILHLEKALTVLKEATLPMGGDQQIKAGIYDRLVRLETIAGHPEEAKRWSEKAREAGKKPAGKR